MKAAVDRLKESSLIEVINTMTNRYKRVVRFDVRLLECDLSQAEAKPTVEPMQPIHEPGFVKSARDPNESGTPAQEPLLAVDPVLGPIQPSMSMESPSLENRFTPLRRLENEMRAYMRDVKRYEDWRIGQILGVMCKVPMDDRRRVFYAIVNKHGDSPAAVLTEVRNYVDRKKRRERAEAQELFELEAMSLFVTA